MAVVPWWDYRGHKVCEFDGDFLVHVLAQYKDFGFAGLRLKFLKIQRLLKSYLSLTPRRSSST